MNHTIKQINIDINSFICHTYYRANVEQIFSMLNFAWFDGLGDGSVESFGSVSLLFV